MTRYAAILVAAWMLVGCRAPAPSFDVLAPYGSPTVPAPRTGAIGTSGTYYAPMNQGTQPTATAPVTPSPQGTTTPTAPPSSQPVAPPSSFMGASDTTLAAGAPDVSMASYQAGATHQVPPPATTIMSGPSSQGAVADAAGPTEQFVVHVESQRHAGQRCHATGRTAVLQFGRRTGQHQQSAVRQQQCSIVSAVHQSQDGGEQRYGGRRSSREHRVHGHLADPLSPTMSHRQRCLDKTRVAQIDSPNPSQRRGTRRKMTVHKSRGDRLHAGHGEPIGCGDRRLEQDQFLSLADFRETCGNTVACDVPSDRKPDAR